MVKKKTKKARAKIYGNNITHYLDELGMTQVELANEIPTDEGHLSKIISAKRVHISLPIAARIAEILKQPIEKVFITKKPEVVDKKAEENQVE